MATVVVSARPEALSSVSAPVRLKIEEPPAMSLPKAEVCRSGFKCLLGPLTVSVAILQGLKISEAVPCCHCVVDSITGFAFL